jgi:hypothetical protein
MPADWLRVADSAAGTAGHSAITSASASASATPPPPAAAEASEQGSKQVVTGAAQCSSLQRSAAANVCGAARVLLEGPRSVRARGAAAAAALLPVQLPDG